MTRRHLALAALTAFALAGCSTVPAPQLPAPPVEAGPVVDAGQAATPSAPTASPLPGSPPSTPTAVPPPTPSPTPTAEAARAVPVLDPEALIDDHIGASLFVLHTIELMEYAYATGDTAPFLAVTDPGCLACTLQMDAVRSRYDAGWRLLQGDFEMGIGYQVEAFHATSEYLVDLQLASTALSFASAEVDGVDTFVDVERWDPQDMRYHVAFRDGAWVLLSIGPFDPETQLKLTEEPTS